MFENRLFAIGLTLAVLGLGAATIAVRGFGERTAPAKAGEIAMAEGVLLETGADRNRFLFSDETPAAKAELKRVFGLAQEEDAPVLESVKLDCALSPELSSFAAFLQPGAHYRVYYRTGSQPYLVTRIEPLVAPVADAKVFIPPVPH